MEAPEVVGVEAVCHSVRHTDIPALEQRRPVCVGCSKVGIDAAVPAHLDAWREEKDEPPRIRAITARANSSKQQKRDVVLKKLIRFGTVGRRTPRTFRQGECSSGQGTL